MERVSASCAGQSGDRRSFRAECNQIFPHSEEKRVCTYDECLRALAGQACKCGFKFTFLACLKSNDLTVE
jgi:hypothetical protein